MSDAELQGATTSPIQIPWAVPSSIAVVDAAVEAGDRGFSSCVTKGAEPARGESAAVVGVVGEAVAVTEELGQDLEGRPDWTEWPVCRCLPGGT
jgi:hypothetical protein